MADVQSQVRHITALDFDISRAEAQLASLQSQMDSITSRIASSNWTINAIINGQSDYANLRKELDNLRRQYTAVTNQLLEAQNQIANMQNAHHQAAENMTQDTSRLASTIETRLVSVLEQAAVAAAKTVKSTEDSMVEISRVLELSGSQADSMREKLFGLGNEFGRSFEDVSAIALRYAQAGYDMNDTLTQTKGFLLALNTAELDVENGVQSLIGIMSQWGMEASELESVIDKLNYTADTNAITTQDLVDGLLKASSMAKTAGMSFDETVGSLTALKVASGAAGKEVGNAFKSILAYIQRPDSLKVFDSMGIDVYADRVTGELIPMMDILENMSAKWNEGAASQQNMIDTLVASGDALQMMSEEWAIATDSIDEYNQYQEAMAEATDKANTAEARAQAQAAAGVFRRNYYISLMENFANAVQVSNDLVNAEGHSMQENSRYMETLTAKCEQLVVSLKELAVTAADAGLLDLAKEALDTATAMVKWTNESKNLLPVLLAVSGVIVTIKAQKIASEVLAIGGAFNNAAGAFKTAALAMNGAEGAAISLNAALGAVGIAITVIGTVVAVVKDVTAKMHEARMECIETGKAAAEEAEELTSLKEKYEELINISERTVEQEQEFQSTQDSIIDLLGKRAEKLRGLTEGTKEYNDELERQIQLELASKLDKMGEATEAAQKELDITVSRGTTGSFYLGWDGEAKDALESAGKVRYDIDNSAYVDYEGKNALETYANLADIIDILDNKYLELLNTNKAAAELFLDDETYKRLKASYEEVGEAAQTYLIAAVEEAQTRYIALGNEIPKTVQEQEKMNKAIVEAVDPTGRLKDEITSLITVYGTIDQQKIDFFELLNADGYEDVKNKLFSLAEAGQLNIYTYQGVKEMYGDFGKKLGEIGYGAADVVNAVNEAAGAEKALADGAGTAAESIDDTEKQLKSLSDSIKTAESNISALNGYIDTLNKGNGLTAEQVMKLCDNYGLLAEQFTLTENGYKIETSALETLRDSHIQTAAASRKAQAEMTLITSQNIRERIKSYGLEIMSLTSVAETEAAIIELEKKRDEMAGKISSSTAKEYGAKFTDINNIIQNIRKLGTEYANIDAMSEDFYKNLGKSFESAAGSSKKASEEGEKTVDVLKELTDGYEKLVALGLYSTEEQIAYYEDLRRSLDLTMEQYEKLEATLHKLYKTQLEESKAAAKEEYENYKKTKEDEYKATKEALEKQLSDEKDARKQYWADELDKLKSNLNAQISAAKSAYEEKKKLAQKSHDNQVKALESLRDMEIDNINSVYNAQIDALEKIKAARNSERSEEDYQDERAELLEQISYYEQRTGTEAVENLKNLRKQLADLDKRRKREVEDEQTDKQIESLKSQRDSEAAEAEKYYNAQIAALKTAQETEVEMYEETYKREVELLQNRLETETKALEKKRDADLKRLDEEQKKKLKDLEDEKNAAIKAADEKWKQLQKIFEDGNLALIAAAGDFAPKLYDKFHEEFTKNFEADLEKLADLMKELNSQKSSFQYASGSKPTAAAPKSASGSASSSSSSSSNKNKSGGGFSVGTQVKVSGTTYKSYKGDDPQDNVNGKKGTITQIYSSGAKPYRIGTMGWVDASQLVKAKTGGRTTSDGLAMLHKDELVVNPPTLKKLEDFLEKFKPEPYEFKPRIFEAMAREQAKMLRVIQNHNNTYFNSNSSVQNNGGDEYSSTRRNVQNFNGPLMNIERVEDDVDMQAAMNEMERIIMRDVNTRL